MSINMVNATYTHFRKERLLIDSGAQCCVCPKDYAPEIEMTKQGKMDLPGLHSVTGENMKVAGIKYVSYQLTDHRWMTVRYYVADVTVPILAVNGLNSAGYVPVLSQNPYLEQFTHYITDLVKEAGLYYITSWNRSSTNKNNNGTKHLIAGSTSSDYWKIEGTKAIRVHLKPRRFKFTPTMENTCPGNGREDGPCYLD